ncbi:hypothetical protein [Streptomyces poonensis]|uniref:GerMN domain-containing protein n=1 Tax=Streptomyces poonensis TaxID=68255 RepID=A0A918UKR6_9ACTN|nr:hypothetical protein [Streptomyces poonensis]GGZ17531.1 hypothetical protein GCM10010365_41710 [Streptomyces poonensis]GLJ90953.1 hypothetical protein GCM10017589_35590 [Streptomyces poonensis]
MTEGPAVPEGPAVTPAAPCAAPAVRRTLPFLLATGLALAASACGIPATGVVEAGEPATGVLEPGTAVPAEVTGPAAHADTVLVYFLRNGSLVPVTRTVDSPADPGPALLMLFKGPDDQEREEGLATELRPFTVMPTVRTDGATVVIELPEAVGKLSDTATDQLACTAAAARLRQDPDLAAAQVTVTVEQPGGRLAGRSSDHCPGAPTAAEPTAAASVPAVR